MKPPCGKTGERTGCALSLSALGSVFLLGIYCNEKKNRNKTKKHQYRIGMRKSFSSPTLPLTSCMILGKLISC